MDTVRYLLRFLIRFAVALFLAVIVWWLTTALLPGLSMRSLLSYFSLRGEVKESEGWLPAPRNTAGLFGKAKTPSATDNVYVPAKAFSTYGKAFNNNKGGAKVSFVDYSTGEVTTYGNEPLVFNGQQQPVAPIAEANGYKQKSSYIRNLSIYENGPVYTGLSFVGDARSILFEGGVFPVAVVDNAGNVLVIAPAKAIKGFTPIGWTKFQVKFDALLPHGVPCTLIFQQGLTQAQVLQKQQPVRVAMPVVCNSR